MKQLPLADFPRASALFAPLDYHLSIAAVLNGVSEGQVWVDDPANPHSALLKCGHRWLLGGDPANSDFNAALQDFFFTTLFPQIQAAHGKDRGFLLYIDEPWKEVVPTQVLSGAELRLHARRYLELTLTPDTPRGFEPLPEGLRMVALDRALLTDPTLGKREYLLEETCSERDSVEDFIEKSFGICLLHEHSVAGWCLSEYNLGERCEVGIATDEAFRKRGLATRQGLAFFDLAWQAGIRRIGWHCWATNVASWATALRLGMSKVKDYSCFYVTVC
jgi:hypothetical protein